MKFQLLVTSIVALLVGWVGGTLLFAPPADATHTTLTGSTYTYMPYQQPWNGYKVYLSAPRHGLSGSRGELGWEENINGRHWNYYAGNGDYSFGSYNTTDLNRNIRARSYSVTISGNLRDDLHLTHRDYANNWGADVYITTHTNATAGGNYSLYMTDYFTAGTTDNLLRSKLSQLVGGPVPGTEVQSTDNSGYYSGNLGELDAQAWANVYAEIIFHDNQSHVDWFGSGSNWSQSVTTYARRYGWAIDSALGYPRAV